MINITDFSLLKITKVKRWAICFDYNSKHYLIHGDYEFGEGSWQTLYERELDKNGKYTLTRLKDSPYATDDVSYDYIKKQRGKTIVYRDIDKDYFIQKLMTRGFGIINGR